jgi:hypothetical protein
VAAEVDAVAEAAAPDARFDEAPTLLAVRAMEGWCGLRAREGTLDGSLPLRVVQGCEPMLDGVSFGLQVVQRAPLRLTRRWGRWRVDALPYASQVERWGVAGEGPPGASSLERFARQHAAAVPALRARGWLPPDTDALPLWETRGDRLRLWTGYCVRVPSATRLLVLRATPRRTLGIDLAPSVIPAHAGWAPLVVDLRLDADCTEVIIEGEVATLGVVPVGCTLRESSLRDAPEVGRALLDFYDPAYFAAKARGEVTRRYRRLPRPDARDGAGWLQVVRCADDELTPGHFADDVTLPSLTFRCAVDLQVRFDGQRVRLEADDASMHARRGVIERAWSSLATPDDPAHRGAMLYLTRYMTPHPFGEPHFFVKPPDLVVTPAGWCTLVEGEAIVGVGDTLRGVVRTDVFPATPAVFALPTRPTATTLRRGTVLARLLPLPRAWLRPTLRERPLDLSATVEGDRTS